MLTFTPVSDEKIGRSTMGIMLLSIVLAMLLGCVIWLIVGSKFPLKEPLDAKLPALNNIVIYVLGSLVPVYVLLFLVFS